MHARAARMSTVAEVVDNVQVPHSVGYPLTLHYWMKADTSDRWVRFLSVVSGVTAVGLVYLLGARLFTPMEGALAALFVALSSSHVRFSREAAPYAPQTAVLLGAVLLWWTALRTNRWSAWLGFALLAAASHYLHPLASTTTLGLYGVSLLAWWLGLARNQDAVGLSVQPRSFSLLRGLTSLGLFFALIAYQVYENLDKASQYAGTSTTALTGQRYLEEILRLLGGNWVSWLPYVFLPLAAIGAIRLLIVSPLLGLTLIGWASGTVAIWIAFKAVKSHFFDYHYFISHLPAFALLIASGVTALTSAFRLPVAVRNTNAAAWVARGVLLGGLAALLAQSTRLEFNRTWPGYREVGQFLTEQLEAEDRFFIREENYLDFMVQYYCPDVLDREVEIDFFVKPAPRKALETSGGQLYVVGRGVPEPTGEVSVKGFNSLHIAWLDPMKYEPESLQILLEGEGAHAQGLHRANNLMERARSLAEAKAYVEAASAIIEAASEAPHLFSIMRMKGEILLDAGRPSEAIPAFRAAYDLVPAKEKWWMRVCEAKGLYQLKRYDEAIAVLTAALEDPDPSPLYLYRVIGENYYAKAEYALAREFFQKSFDLKPDQDYLLMRIADSFSVEGNFSEAVAYYQKAATLNGPELESINRKLEAAEKALNR